jgi:DMSO/TMAO reductase YedYZ heme-binding membrane subunit
MVAAGQIALLLAVIDVASFSVRRRIGQRVWRALHTTTFLAFAAATVHGILSGTDTSQPWAWWLYVVACATVTFLVVVRLVV